MRVPLGVLLEASWGLLGASWGPLGGLLEASWESGASWGPIGPSRGLHGPGKFARQDAAGPRARAGKPRRRAGASEYLGARARAP